VLAAPGVLAYYVTGAALYQLTGDDTYAAQASTFAKGAEAVADAFSSKEKAANFVVGGFTAGLKQAEAAIDRGDAFAAGEGGGEFAMQVALLADAGSRIKLNVQGARALATAEGATRAGLRVLTATGPDLGSAAVAMAKVVTQEGEQQGTRGSGAAEEPVTENEASPGGQRLPPNPYGKKGGPGHQAEVASVVRDVESRGLEAQQEFRVETPKGAKKRRFVDVAGVNRMTGEVEELHQVGKQTKGGQPVARERQALEDIQEATGQNPEFHPYNRETDPVPSVNSAPIGQGTNPSPGQEIP